ncbi:MAG: hypothetical protein COV44_10970 [Deltaproteobacteria bacterium CG11_big_fil_rev_8_21_14_0_20_45_16]|nr:MAG: hypothetical protein COV44_10970 [Deltaproteobacteria bacterium CG11_big_fil_rev_8_21_14_0_20_45_16]
MPLAVQSTPIEAHSSNDLAARVSANAISEIHATSDLDHKNQNDHQLNETKMGALKISESLKIISSG